MRAITADDSGMGQRAPYIPRADGRLRDWLCNFARVLNDSPALFNVPEQAAAEAMAVADRFAEAYAAATSPQAGSPSTTRRKNEVRKEAWVFFRGVSMQIKRSRAVPNDAKMAIGVIPDHREQSRVQQPTTRPILMLDSTRGLSHRLRRFDPQHPTRWAKPYGVTLLQLAIAYSRPPAALPSPVPDNPNEWHAFPMVTRHVFSIRHAPKYSGQFATYAGRWMTGRGLVGPWSGTVKAMVTG